MLRGYPILCDLIPSISAAFANFDGIPTIDHVKHGKTSAGTGVELDKRIGHDNLVVRLFAISH